MPSDTRDAHLFMAKVRALGTVAFPAELGQFLSAWGLRVVLLGVLLKKDHFHLETSCLCGCQDPLSLMDHLRQVGPQSCLGHQFSSMGLAFLGLVLLQALACSQCVGGAGDRCAFLVFLWPGPGGGEKELRTRPGPAPGHHATALLRRWALAVPMQGPSRNVNQVSVHKGAELPPSPQTRV